jgi:hypothetical protein
MKNLVELLADETNSDRRAIAVGLIALSGSIAAVVLVEALA